MIMKKSALCLVLVFAVPLVLRSQCPDYFSDMLEKNCPQIENLKKTQRDGFFFWTDSHLNANSFNTPSVIKATVQKCALDTKVIFGGDVEPAFGTSIAEYMNRQIEIGKDIQTFARNYNVRGNHDFTIRLANDSPEGYTLPQDSTAMAIFTATEKDVVRNPDDPWGCYYYFDEPSSHIRYFVLETTDSTSAGNKPWGVQSTMRKTQVDWLFDTAVPSTPRRWSLVFISHIPFSSEFGGESDFTKVRSRIEAISSQRPDLKVLMVLSGHRHHDISFYENGILHVVTASDAYYQDFNRSPIHSQDPERQTGTPGEIAFDYVSIGKRTIDMVRFGICSSRSFTLKPVTLKVGKRKKLSRLCPDAVSWMEYDSRGNQYVRGAGYTAIWKLSNKVATVGENGTVEALSEGEATVVAIDGEGKEHYFYIKVR